MRLAISADNHGNVLALEAVLADLEHRSGPDRQRRRLSVGLLCPRETVEPLMRWPTTRGNHDRWVTDWPPKRHYPSDAFAYRALHSAQIAWLRTLAPTRDLGDGILDCQAPRSHRFTNWPCRSVL
jgi:hypothetical protein